MLFAVSFIANPASIVPGIRPLEPPRVEGLVRRLRVLDEAGHACRPGVRHVILEPDEEMRGY